MGTITKRKRSNGSTGYTAQIRLMRDGKAVHSEAKTFDRRQAAQAWIGKREAELSKPGALEETKRPKATLADVIDCYVRESVKGIGRTKGQVLQAIKSYAIADLDVKDIDSTQLVGFAKELSEGRQPQTVQNYLSHLSSIFAIARPAWGYDLEPQAMADAQKVLKRLGIISKSKKRTRRPTMEELDLLMAHFADRSKRTPQAMPMHRVIAFALFSTRRQEEITLIAWDDLDEDGCRVLVRDMKNPGEKVGNDIWCEMPPEALEIVKAMKGADPKRIFPYSTDAISANFTRAVKVLGIENLHFHDLRHEGVSRLFEMGRSVPQAASVSGHRSWSSLQIYAHLRHSGDRFAGWRWLPAVTAPVRQKS